MAGDVVNWTFYLASTFVVYWQFSAPKSATAPSAKTLSAIFTTRLCKIRQVKKFINVILFILLFLVTKELIYIFYESWNFLILNIVDEYEYLKFSISIAVASFLFSFIFLVLFFAFKNLNIIYKTVSYFVSLALSLIVVNFIYFQFKDEINFVQILLNLTTVLVVFSVLNYIILQVLEKKILKIK